MPTKLKVDGFFEEAKRIFWEKNKQRGTTLNPHEALTLAKVKLDRIHDDPADFDSYLDLANYGLILSLMQAGEWHDGIKEEETLRIDDLILVKTHQEGGGISTPKYDGDAGFDLTTSEDITITPFGDGTTNVPLGFSLKLPIGYWAEIRPRSSTATKMGLFVHQSVMDNLYTGPWFVVANALGTQPKFIEKGTRIAQCILHRLNRCDVLAVDELPITQRGENGFGSSGIK